LRRGGGGVQLGGGHRKKAKHRTSKKHFAIKEKREGKGKTVFGSFSHSKAARSKEEERAGPHNGRAACGGG